MRRLRVLVLAALLGGCASPPAFDEGVFLRLQAGSPAERADAFQSLLRAGPAATPALRAAMGLGARQGFPAVALLYAQGRGDGVPLDLRAIHLASFEWPDAHRSENALVEVYVREELEQDLARIGRPVLPLLGRALEFDAASEEGAVRVLRAMIRIGGRAAAEEFARLLSVPKSLGELRVCEAAAAALLYLGFQDLPLRLADPAARVEAAREWWELAKDFPESEWLREAMDQLGARAAPKDPEGVGSVMALLAGEPLEDPRAWRDGHPGWTPAPPVLHPEDLLRRLPLGRAQAFDANRRLELATGTKVWMPPFARVSELCAALRLWRAPADLELRWTRYLRSPLLRLSIAAIGSSGFRWAYESYLRPPESESGELRIDLSDEHYGLFVHARELGTRILLSESFVAPEGGGIRFLDVRDGRPALLFSAPFRSAIVAVVEEVESRRPTPAPAAAALEWRARLRERADSAEALRALAYFQAEEDRALFRERHAGAALLLLGDPAALELRPELEAHEIEMALRKAEDPRVKRYLEELRARISRRP